MDSKNRPLFRDYKNGALLGFGLSVAGSIVIGLESYFAPGTLFTNPEMKDFPYRSIATYTVYQNIKCQMLFIGCHLMCKQNLLESVTHFQVKIDDRYISSLADLNEVKDVVLAKSPQFYDTYLKLGFEKHKEILLKQECYQFKDFFTKMGIDWRPSKEMYQRVEGKKLTDDVTTYDLSLAEYKEKMGVNYLMEAYRE